jgi:hypothetical protein
MAVDVIQSAFVLSELPRHREPTGLDHDVIAGRCAGVLAPKAVLST